MKSYSSSKLKNFLHIQQAVKCYEFFLYFRYSALNLRDCYCINIIKTREEEKDSCNIKCLDNVHFCGGPNTESLYDTGVTVPGPVVNPKVESDADSILIIKWGNPVTGTPVASYKIIAAPIKSYSSGPLQNITWTAQNDRQKFELLNLHPATTYQIELTSLSHTGQEGGSVRLQEVTQIGYPDIPEPPKILEEKDNKIKIEISNSYVNNNGPISSYRIIVHFVDNELIQEFDENRLEGFQKATVDGLPYYITAEIPYRNKTEIFTIGDNSQYGNYFNQELTTDRHVHIILAVVSRLNNLEKITYSEFAHNHIHILDTHDNNHFEPNSGSDGLIIVLSVLCIVCGLLLVGSIIVYGYIRIKLGKRPDRFERHEMSMQGPILEVVSFLITDNSNFNLTFHKFSGQ